MATRSSSFTSSSEPACAGPLGAGPRLAATLAWALAFVVALNAWVGLRLEALAGESLIGQLLELDVQLGRLREPARVEVLVLGNSHAQHMLRAPSLGPALGLRPDAVFSLAMPGATAFETGLIARRYAPRFPKARLALVGVDEVLLAMDPAYYDQRVRFLTRFDPPARWRHALAAPDLEGKVSALAWLPFPLADFAPTLLHELAAARGGMAGRLVGGPAAPAPRSALREADLRQYPWGSPPRYDRPWDTPRGRLLRRTFQTDAWLAQRARLFFGGASRVGRALEDLEATCRALEARGLVVELVAPVYMPAMHAYLARAHVEERRHLDAALRAHLAATGRTLHAPAIEPSLAAFIDADHLSAEGARRFARALAPRLRGARGDG